MRANYFDTPPRFTSRQGFTIVELLIVVVVIAILAAITIVSYNGITKRANESAVQSTLSQAFTGLTMYQLNNSGGLFPTALTDAGLNFTSGGGTTYAYTASSDGKSFCLASSQAGRTYFVSDTSSSPQKGICNGAVGVIGTGDVAVDGPSTSGPAATYSIYNGQTPSGTISVESDGGGSLKVGNRFYTNENAGIKVKGLRVYNPTVSSGPFLALGITAYAYVNDYTGGQVNGSTTLAGTPVATKTFSGTRTAGTWTDILFTTPFTLPKIAPSAGTNDLLTLLVQYSGGNHYVYVNPSPNSGNEVNSTIRPGTFLAESSGLGREVNSISGGSGSNYYGIDILFEPVTP